MGVDAINAPRINQNTKASDYSALTAVYDIKTGWFTGENSEDSRLELNAYSPSFGTSASSVSYKSLVKSLDCLHELYAVQSRSEELNSLYNLCDPIFEKYQLHPVTFADLKIEDGLLASREAYLTPSESRGKPQRLDYIFYYNNPLIHVVGA